MKLPYDIYINSRCVIIYDEAILNICGDSNLTRTKLPLKKIFNISLVDDGEESQIIEQLLIDTNNINVSL